MFSEVGGNQYCSYIMQVIWSTLKMVGNESISDSDTVNGSTTSYVIANLLPITNYTVKLHAINRKGRGMGSNEQSILTLPTGELQ